ncbi:signal transduction histidine kinase [Paraburkholderia sp. BL10I2N1]|nr:signal transduction histidine kinase [Paraburkholderia sp. BL10I2N1]
MRQALNVPGPELPAPAPRASASVCSKNYNSFDTAILSHVNRMNYNPELTMAGPSAAPAADRAERAGTLITTVLDERLHRVPDFAAESHALHRLAQALTASDSAVLQTLADTARELCGSGSAGISLLERNADRTPAFRWVALSGRCAALADKVTLFEDSPEGVTLEMGAAQLFSFPERHVACLSSAVPEVVEELVVPIPGTPEPWGTLWVMSHDEHHRFDAEHRRILTSLANFTCAALTVTQAKADAEARAEEAEAARNALAKAEAHKDDFIAMLGHELRNPIAPIDGALAAAQKLAADSPAVLSALAVANRQVRQLKRLVSDLLDASRIRHGKLSVRHSYSLLADIVKDALATVRLDADGRQHELHVTVPAYPVTVYADQARLTQVISNLLSNAVKYTPPGGTITLSVEAPDPGTIPTHDATPREAVVTVRDSGVGISPAFLPHVFDMFAQSAAVRTRAEGGLGVGLSVVKYLVNAHNGLITLSSEGDGKGTEVTVRLPIVCRTPVEPSNATSHGTTPARILLVDDNADATEALATLLALEGHEVKRAQSGPEALSMVDSFTPDVALIDIGMPGMDGRELARLLREHEQCPETKLVALTGYADAASRLGDVEGAFDCYLVKPLSLDDLAEVLRGS